MNARMKTSGRPGVSPFVITPDQACRALPQGTWTRLQRALGRLVLLMGSPIASFRWARAKRRALAQKNEAQLSRKQNHSDGFADGEGLGVLGL